MLKKSNPIYLGAYRVVLRGSQGRFTNSYYSAKTYQLYLGKRKLYKKPLEFPKKFRKSIDRSKYLFREINKLEKERKRKSAENKLRRKNALIKKYLMHLKRARSEKTKIKYRALLKKLKPDFIDPSKKRKILSKKQKTLLKKQKALSEKRKTLLEKQKALLKKQKALSKKQKTLAKQKTLSFSRKVITKSKLLSDFHDDGYPRDITVRTHTITHDPLRFNSKSMKKVLKEMKPQYVQALTSLWKRLKPSQKFFIIRIIYRHPLKSGQLVERGFGIAREHITKETTIEKRIQKLIDHAYHRFIVGDVTSEAYFTKQMIPREVELIGFTIEYISSITKKYTSERSYDLRLREWEKRKRFWRQKAERTKEKIKKGMG